MPNLFVPNHARPADATQYYYVEKREGFIVQERTQLNWPLKDKKGRIVGFAWSIVRQVTTLEEGEHNPRHHGLHPVGEPLEVFIATGCSTRNGYTFGSATIVVRGTDLEAVRVEFLRRVDRARNAATKKFGQQL